MPPTRKLSRTPPPQTLNIPESSVQLQDRLHELLSRLSTTLDQIRNWPSAAGGEDASIHVESTGRLIQSIKSVLKSVQQVESVVKNNVELRTRLNACQIPLDLLDLLDHGGGLNPSCFARGLLGEAAGQLQGLKRRKFALERLGDAVQAGLEAKQNKATTLVKGEEPKTMTEPSASHKRPREEGTEDEEKSEEPPAKKAHTDTTQD